MNTELDTTILTIRARIALVLAVAECILIELATDPEGFSLGQEALNRAWEWEETGSVAAKALAEYVDSPTAKDLGVRELYYDGNENMISAIIAITLTVGYVAMHAYQLEHAKHLPEPIEQIDEDTIEQIFEFASQTAAFNEECIIKVYNHLLKSFKSNTIDELGESICRDRVMAALKS